eukprot:91784-Chlamydomonas_euryale.AAC.4
MPKPPVNETSVPDAVWLFACIAAHACRRCAYAALGLLPRHAVIACIAGHARRHPPPAGAGPPAATGRDCMHRDARMSTPSASSPWFPTAAGRDRMHRGACMHIDTVRSRRLCLLQTLNPLPLRLNPRMLVRPRRGAHMCAGPCA